MLLPLIQHLRNDVLFFADLAAEGARGLFMSLVSNPSHVLSRHLPAIKTTNYNLRPRAHGFTLPKRIIVILSLVCFLKGFIVSDFDFLVCDLPRFLTYLRFVYIFPDSFYS